VDVLELVSVEVTAVLLFQVITAVQALSPPILVEALVTTVVITVAVITVDVLLHEFCRIMDTPLRMCRINRIITAIPHLTTDLWLLLLLFMVVTVVVGNIGCVDQSGFASFVQGTAAFG
jgi:hypothetical protein